MADGILFGNKMIRKTGQSLLKEYGQILRLTVSLVGIMMQK